ncbi:tRNA lysidine(34) synthetase TilS [bacterium]|nr:tRNA lysidine(34) synthetase TilS [bacterium]
MKNAIKSFILNCKLENSKIIVGFSGGADSVCLLHVLHTLKDELNLTIIPVHLNHNWRGEHSKADEVFAQNFAQKLNLKFYSETLDNSVQKTETAARDARYNFFEKAKEKFGADIIMLAHNKDDNIETAIYRIIKGTGIEGLKAIPEVREDIFRPLLNFEKAEILEYLKNNNLEHTEDSSNQDTTYARNYIRHKILPDFEKINPTYKNSISNLIQVAKGESEILDFVLEETKKDIFENNKINTQKFLKLIYPLQLKLMYNYLKGDLKFFDYKRFQRIVDFVVEHANKKDNFNSRKYVKFSINSKLFLYINQKEIFKGE